MIDCLALALGTGNHLTLSVNAARMKSISRCSGAPTRQTSVRPKEINLRVMRVTTSNVLQNLKRDFTKEESTEVYNQRRNDKSYELSKTQYPRGC